MMDMTTRPTLQHFLSDTKHGPYVSLYMSWPENTEVAVQKHGEAYQERHDRDLS